MRLPSKGSGYGVYVRYGRYVAQRLRRAGQDSLAEGVKGAIDEVRSAGRAWEDSDEALQDALADRDGADDDLDSAAREARSTLAGRSVNAEREEPFTLIFPKGLGYYTAAPLALEEPRYNELKLRLEENLPAGDPVRKSGTGAVTRGLKDFRGANTALTEATARESMAGTRARQAIGSFVRQIEKTHGAMIVEVGKARAEVFFPRSSSGRAEEDSDPPEGGGAGKPPEKPPTG